MEGRHGLDRVGLSYANLNSAELWGVEGVMSAMGVSIKSGYYTGIDEASNECLIGIGFGF